MCGCPLEYDWPTRSNTFKQTNNKTDPSSPSSFQLLMSLGTSSLLHAGILSALSLCRFCGFCHNCYEFTCATAPIVSRKHCFFGVIHHLLQSFHPFFRNDSWSLVCDIWMYSLGRNTLLSLIFCTLNSCESLCQSPSTAKEAFGDKGQDTYYSLGITKSYWKSIQYSI